MRRKVVMLMILVLMITITTAAQAGVLEELRAETNRLREIKSSPISLMLYLQAQGLEIGWLPDDELFYIGATTSYGLEGLGLMWDAETLWWGTFYKGRLECGRIMAVNGLFVVDEFKITRLK